MKQTMLSKLPNFAKPSTNKNVIIHALNCVSIPPEKSHPNRYWKKDSKRFLNLAFKALVNNADLILLNYSVKSKFIKAIYVRNIERDNGITEYTEEVMQKGDYNTWLTDLKKTKKVL